MKNQECKNCEIQADVHKAIFGVGLINNLCVVCAGETVAFPKNEMQRNIQNFTIAEIVKVKASKPKVNVTNDEREWSPEIAEAMRIPH